MGALELVAALPTSSTSWLLEPWVSSTVKLVITSSELGALNSKPQSFDVELIVELVYVVLQYRLIYFYSWNSYFWWG